MQGTRSEMDRGTTQKSMEDPDDDEPLFPKDWNPKKTPDDDKQLFPKD
jgi:hypothetical protein